MVMIYKGDQALPSELKIDDHMLQEYIDRKKVVRVFNNYVQCGRQLGLINNKAELKLNLPSNGLHPAKGSPENPSSQEQMG